MSLLFILVLSLVGALLESASIQMTRSRKRADVNLALESVFAEYHPEMLHIYDLFVRFGSDEETLRNRMEYYGAGNMSHQLIKRELLTDYEGAVYYNQAIRYMKDLLGLEHNPGESKEIPKELSYEEKERSILGELKPLLDEEEVGLKGEDNPLDLAGRQKTMGLLSLLIGRDTSVSQQNLVIETLPSHRTLQQGDYPKQDTGGTTEALFFQAYLMEHFFHYTESKETRALLYELEYLLEGEESDRENLEAVCRKLVNLRMAVNYAYLLTDAGRQAEAEAMALTLCSLVLNPEVTPLVKQAVLLAWAYAESIVDVRALLRDKKVPVVKTADTWQIQLANVSKLGTGEEISGEKNFETGLAYADYLKALLLSEKKETLCMRSLDLIEANLHMKADQCTTKVQIKTKVELRRGVRDEFLTTFAYQ